MENHRATSHHRSHFSSRSYIQCIKTFLSKLDSHNGALFCQGTENTTSLVVFFLNILCMLNISLSLSQFVWKWSLAGLSPKWLVEDNQLRQNFSVNKFAFHILFVVLF